MEFRRLCAKVHLDRIEKNLDTVRAKVGNNVKILAVIKADAYGHGAVEVAHYIDKKADMFAVANIDEAMELRDSGITKDILLLGHTDPEEFCDVIDYGITIAIFSLEDAKILDALANRKGKTAKVHIKVDTGMSRIGYQVCPQAADEVAEMAKLENVCVEGLFTHMARADETDKTSALSQRAKFDEFLSLCAERGVEFKIRHINNSAGIIEFDKYYDMVREGITLYGLEPSGDTDRAYPLYPAMELVARISHIKVLEAGRGISYGHTFVTTKATKVATIPCGYADGYPRCLSNIGHVIIAGVKCPILGRVCMDQFMVDVSALDNVQIGDEAVLFGEGLSVEEMSGMAHSFNYEMVCTVGRRVPRAYFVGDEHVKTVSYLK